MTNSNSKLLMLVFLLVVTALSPCATSQTTYYVSTGGNDNNSGTSPSAAWQTIGKVTSASYLPGDQILFQRGDEFFGQITLAQSGSGASPITVGSYGSSDRKPVITGAVALSGWSVYRGAIYMAKAPLPVKNLFCNGVQMTLARYPNAGFLTIGSTNGSTTISATGIHQAPGYWDGTTFRFRSSSFTFENRTVSSYNGTTITLTTSPAHPVVAGWGFYLDNKLEELDAPGEWYCDPTTNTVYFYPPNGADPGGLSIDAGVLDFGITSTQNNITVRDLEFRYQSQAALRFNGTPTNIQILSNDIFGGLLIGIHIDGSSSNCILDGNTVANINGRGISLTNTRATTISNNTVRNIGLVQGYGISAENGMTGIFLQRGSNNIIRGNSIDSVGYAGIHPDGSYNLVENNVLTNSMLRLADGGALYCYSNLPSINYGNVWRNNIIVDVLGNVDGVPQPASKQANGIYLDHGCYDLLVEGNTVIRAGSNGLIMSRNSYRNIIRGNVFYDCGRNPDSYYLYFLQDPAKNYGQNVIVKNVFYPLDSVQTLVMIQEDNSVCHTPGTLDSNYYCSPYNNLPVRTLTYANKWVYNEYSLEQWQAYSGQDQHSKGLFAKLHPFVVSDSSAPSLIQNGQFQTGIAGWGDWRTNTQVKHVASAGLDGGCLQFRLDPAIGINQAAASPNVALTRGTWYQLRFSVRAEKKGLLTVAARQDHIPYTTLHAPMVFPIGPERANLECYLLADATDPEVRVEFRVTHPDTLFYLDNVIFRPVMGEYVSPESRAPVFVNNTSQIKTVDLGQDAFRDLDGNHLSGTIELAPYSSQVLIRQGITEQKTTGAEKKTDLIPGQFELLQNYPNPFNPSTTIRYALPVASKVRLEVFDALGRRVALLVDEMQDPGYHEAVFTSNALASGVYFYRLQAGSFSTARKSFLIR